MTIALERVSRINGRGGASARLVLNDITAVFPPGRTTGILGLRGAGKSTLIRVLAGIVPPSSGRVLRRGRVSFPIGQLGWMHRHMSGRENLRFLALVYNLDPKPIIDFVADVTGLGPVLDQPMGTYSGEKRARLGFAASYAVPFDVYLGDEYLIGGPPGFRDLCRTLVRERQREATFILATRSPALVRLFCDSAVILADGGLYPCDTVQDALAEHARLTAESLTDDEPAGDAAPASGFWDEGAAGAE